MVVVGISRILSFRCMLLKWYRSHCHNQWRVARSSAADLPSRLAWTWHTSNLIIISVWCPGPRRSSTPRIRISSDEWSLPSCNLLLRALRTSDSPRRRLVGSKGSRSHSEMRRGRVRFLHGDTSLKAKVILCRSHPPVRNKPASSPRSRTVRSPTIFQKAASRQVASYSWGWSTPLIPQMWG